MPVSAVRLYRPVNEVRGRERRREFKDGGRNIITTFTYRVLHDTKPHQWECNACQHLGWLKVPLTCEACGKIGTVHPAKRPDICVVHRDQEGKAYAWDDVSGSELDPLLTLRAREEEMTQFRKHEVYEKVREEVCWAVTGKAPIGSRWIDINKGDESNPDYRSRLVAQQIKHHSKDKKKTSSLPRPRWKPKS